MTGTLVETGAARVVSAVKTYGIGDAVVQALDGVPHVLGLAVGWGLIASIDRLSDANISLGFPAKQLLLVIVLGIALGYVSAIIPARCATRAEVLDAIQST